MPESSQEVVLNVKAAGDAPDRIKEMLAQFKELLRTEQQVKKTADETAKAREQAAKQAKEELEFRKKSAAEAEKEAKKRSDQRLSNVRAGAGMVTNPMGALSGGAMGNGGAMVAAISQAVEKGINTTARVLEINNQAFSTTAQKRRQWQDEYLPFSESLHKLGDAISNVAGRIEREGLRFAAAVAQQQIKIQEAQALRPVQAEGRYLSARAGAMANIENTGPAYIDRSTVRGERQYQEQQIRQPGRQAMAIAQAEAAAARDAAGRERGRETQLRAEVEAAEREFRRRVQHSQQLRLNEDVSGVRNEAGRTQAHNDVELAANDLAAKSAALAEQAARAKEMGLRAVEAESQIRKVAIEQGRQELEILKQREQRMSAVATSLGAMGRAGRMQAERALKRFIKRGPEASTPQDIAAAAQIAPEYVQRRNEQFGERYAQGIRQRLGAEGANVFDRDFTRNETIAQLRRQQNTAQVSLAAQINLDTQATAAALAQQIAPLIAALERAFEAQFNNARDRATEDAYRRSNSSQGAARK